MEMFLKDRIKAFMALFGLKYRTIPKRFWGISPWHDIQMILSDKEFCVEKRPITTIFDVGANEGQTAVVLREQFPSAQLYCFEPSETTFQKLSHTVEYDPTIRTFQMALGSQVEDKILFEYESSVLNSFESHTPVSSADKSVRQTSVTLSTIDNFCRESGIDSIDILKVDTEGFDLEVLKGAEEMLQNKQIRFICFEFFNISSAGKYSAGIDLALIDNYLRAHNFRPVSFYTDFVNPTRPITHFNALMMRWP